MTYIKMSFGRRLGWSISITFMFDEVVWAPMIFQQDNQQLVNVFQLDFLSGYSCQRSQLMLQFFEFLNGMNETYNWCVLRKNAKNWYSKKHYFTCLRLENIRYFCAGYVVYVMMCKGECNEKVLWPCISIFISVRGCKLSHFNWILLHPTPKTCLEDKLVVSCMCHLILILKDLLLNV